MTSLIAGDAKILKSDEAGRVQTPPERREELLDEFERSGLSGAKFAALVGVKYPTFAAWMQKRRRGRRSDGDATRASERKLQWLEAVVEQAQGSSAGDGRGVVLELSGGMRLLVADEAQVPVAVAMVRALGKPC